MFRSPLIDGFVIIIVLLLIVGPKKLPAMGRGLGEGMREFKDGITGGEQKNEAPKVTLQPPPAAAPAPVATEQRPTQAASSTGHQAGSEQRGA